MLVLRKYRSKLLLFSFLILLSCQSESEEQKTNTQVSITKSSPMTSYLERVAMVMTADDNIIDKSSYCTVKLPYSVTVNNTSIAIYTRADYKKVTDNINANTNDDDIVKITFPVTMIFYDYQEKLIENQSEFDYLLSYWNAMPDLWAKISCLNINYPIVINVYNSSNLNATSVIIATDEALYNFLGKLTASQLFAINYPISIRDDQNHTKIINTNSQFNDVIEEAVTNCSSNINSSLDFLETLLSVNWKVGYYYDESDKTSLYKDYQLEFNNDFTVKVTKASLVVNGTWETRLENGVREFRIHFDSDNSLHELDEDWRLFEFNSSQIRFRSSTDNGGLQTNYLYFSKIY